MFRKSRQSETLSLHNSISQSEIKRSNYFQDLSHRYRSYSIDLSHRKITQTVQQIKQKQVLRFKPVPFQVFKSNKPLTEFKEFKLRTADRCKSRERMHYREKYIYSIQFKEMKVCSIIIQNKKGQNIFVVSSHDYSHELSLQYSKDIYNYILSQISKIIEKKKIGAGKKIDRSLVLDSNYLCICNVSKEAIFLVIVKRSELFLGYESIKKLTEFYSLYYKQELTSKRYQEMLLLLEEFLYTKEIIPSKLQFNLQRLNSTSSRSTPDCEQLSKFTSFQATTEKNLIANIPLKYVKKQQVVEKQIEIINQFLKPITSLQSYKCNQEENDWKNKYKNSLYDFAFKLKSKQVHKENIYKKYQPQKSQTLNKQQNISKQSVKNQYVGISSSDIEIMKQKFKVNQQPLQQQQIKQQKQNNPIINQNKLQQQTQQIENNKQQKSGHEDLLGLDQEPQQPITIIPPPIQENQFDLSTISLSPLQQQESSLKMLEKMIISQKDGRLKELKIFGQIALEGDFTEDDANLQLLGTCWQDSYGCQRRITPNSLELKQINDNSYKILIKTALHKTPKGVIDYIIPTKAFTQQRIPVIFLYRLESQQSFASFCLQYKVNDQWKIPLTDFVIEVKLEKDIEYDDLKTMPQALNISDKQITWKTKQLMPQQKGKLILNLIGLKKPASQALSFIKISLKANTSVIEDMDCIMFYRIQEQKCQKRLSVEYKIYPNS